jgi:streptomycin 3"-adenylyltransferase
LHEAVRVLEEVLRDKLMGAYLHGSAVLDGLRPASDLDVLAVSAGRLSDSERELFARQFLHTSGAYPAPSRRPLDIEVVCVTDVRPWRYPPRVEFHYGEWLRESFERRDGQAMSARFDPDVTIAIALTLAAGAVLVGPAPAQLLDTIPMPDLHRAMLEGIEPLVENLEWDTWNVLLTLARIWHTLDSGAIVSKSVAAEWAISRLTSTDATILRRARDWYLGRGADPSAELRREARSTAASMLREIRLQ